MAGRLSCQLEATEIRWKFIINVFVVKFQSIYKFDYIIDFKYIYAFKQRINARILFATCYYFNDTFL